jgi:Cu-processing system permease protein
MRPLLRKEMRDALKNRWLQGYAVLLGSLGLVAAWTASRGAAGLGLQMFGRTTATLTNFCILLSPLIALTMGASAVAGERDRGTLDHLLAQPLDRRDVFLGKYAGLLASLAIATAAGFFPAGALIAASAGPRALLHYLVFPLVAVLLAAAMLALGMLLSVSSRSGVQAQGRAISLWFAFVLLYDLLLMGTLMSANLDEGVLVALLLANPVDAARILVVLVLEPDLYLLGPAGALLLGELTRAGTALLLVGSLAAWTIVPVAWGLRRFRVRRERGLLPAEANTRFCQRYFQWRKARS